MKMRTTILTALLGAAALLAPVTTTAATAAASTAVTDEENISLQISSARLVKNNIVVQGTYSCEAPNKARFIESQAVQYQGEDGDIEVSAFKSLRDRPCTGGKVRFQTTLAPGQGAKFITADQGGSNVFVQVELIVTDQSNMLIDGLYDGTDVEV